MTYRDPDKKPNGSSWQDALDALDGFWTGVFDTADASFDATPFHVVFEEAGGRLLGESIEPNTFSPDPSPELFASLDGWRDDREIEFLKTYEDAVGAGHTVRFEGALDANCDKIEGVWTILGPAARSGPFVMNRVQGESPLV